MKNLPPPHRRANTKKYKEHFLPLFEKTAKEPFVWALKADALVRAASLLRPDVDAYFGDRPCVMPNERVPRGEGIASIYMMLYAFAMENLLKGILIARLPARVGSTKLQKWEGGGHDLLELAKVVGLKLTRNENRVLLSLSVHGEWAGRYPCPINHEDRLPRATSGDGFAPPGGIHQSDLDYTRALYSRLDRALARERRKPSP